MRSDSPKKGLPYRLTKLQDDIERLLNRLTIGVNDVLVCEAPTTMRDPSAAIKVEQVRSIFEGCARRIKASVPGRINPRSVQHDIIGLRGRQAVRKEVKVAAQRAAECLYGADLRAIGFDPSPVELGRHQDIVDAILIGALALTWLERAALAGASADEFFGQAAGRGRAAASGWSLSELPRQAGRARG